MAKSSGVVEGGSAAVVPPQDAGAEAPEKPLVDGPNGGPNGGPGSLGADGRDCDYAALMPEGETSFRARIQAVAKALLAGFKEHDLLTYSSAISFQILTAIVPFLLFVLAVAGIFQADSVWRDHLEPQLRVAVPPSMFRVMDSSVNAVVSGRRGAWLTFGGVFTVWQVSGAIRAVMGALGRIYNAPAERPFVKRFTISFILSIEVGVCFILAIICLLFAPFFFNAAHAGFAIWMVGFVLRWLLVLGLLVFVVGLLVRHAPARPQTVPWVSVGAGIVVASWVVASAVFYFYLVNIASYDTLFGNLAVLIVSMVYLYVSTTVFLFGTQLDAIIRVQATGHAAGEKP